MGTRTYLLGKVLQAFLTLLFVLAFNFFLFRVMPGDPAALLLRGTSAYNPENVQAERERLGLDEPLPKQFVTYMQSTLTWDLGTSFVYQGQEVSQVIGEKV